MTSFVLAGFAGSLYLILLWTVAKKTALRRGLVLGRSPMWIFVGGSIAAAVIGIQQPSAAGLAAMTTIVGSVLCAHIDSKTGYVLDVLTAPMAASALCSALASGFFWNAIVSGAVAGGPLLVLYLLTKGLGIGLGDVKLGTVFGLGLGTETALVAIGIAFIMGAVYGSALLVQGNARRSDPISFGPFLAGGAAIAFGVQIWHAPA